MSPTLLLEDVTKVYGSGSIQTRALDGVSLHVDPGELVVVMGPSGCGKSTLLHVAGGMEPPTAGQVIACDLNVGDATAEELATLRRRDLGFVFQRLNLVPSLTAVENVMLPLELDGMGRRAARGQALEALERVGLHHHLDRYPDDFSGGQQQRIAIARAVTGSRRLLLADEPTGALDSISADGILELLASLARDGDAAVLLVTHEHRFSAFADRVVFLRDGHVVDEVTAARAPEAASAEVQR
jgi:putative ABC transport system ATP-binding protein